jgi:hypothetical protein
VPEPRYVDVIKSKIEICIEDMKREAGFNWLRIVHYYELLHAL